MATLTELATAIKAQIASLPVKFPYTISIATAADDPDLLALAVSHGIGVTNACEWKPVIEKGSAGIAAVRNRGISVLARDRGKLRGMIAYMPEPEPEADDELIPTVSLVRAPTVPTCHLKAI